MYKTSLFIGVFLFGLVAPLLGQTTLMEQANALSEIEAYEKANSIYGQLSKQYLNQQNYKGYLIVNLKIAQNLDNLELTETAIELLDTSTKLYLENLEKDSMLALSYHKLANMYYNSLMEDKTAIVNWENAIAIRQEIFESNHLDIIKTYRNIGNALLNLNRWEEAKDNFQKAIDLNLSRKEVDSLNLAKAYNDLGWVYTNLDDYNKAEKLLLPALTYYQQFYSEEPWILIQVYENIAELYRRKEEYSKVINYQKKILNTYDNFEEKWESDYIRIADSYNNLGLGYDAIDSLPEAIQAYTIAAKINSQYLKEDDIYLAKNYHNLSAVLKKQGEFSEAVKAIEKAINISQKAKNKISLVENLNEKAMILLEKGDKVEALSNINKSFTILLGEEKEVSAADKYFLVLLLNDKLEILNRLGENEKAYLQETIPIIEKINALVHQIRIGYQSDESKSFLAKRVKNVLENTIQTNLTLYKYAKEKHYKIQAFQIAEQAKAIILMDALQSAKSKTRGAVENILLIRENDLIQQIAQKEKEFFLREGDSIALNNELIVLNGALEKLRDSIIQLNPKFYQAKYTTVTSDIASIQAKLKGTLIEYFLGDSTIYTFVLKDKNSEIEIFQTPLNFPLKKWVKNLRTGLYSTYIEKIRDDQKDKAYADTLVTAAHNLYQKLIAPIQERLDLEEQITIIPDGVLGYIPFEVLIKTPPKNNQLYGSLDYMIKEHQINYAYSARLLLEMEQKRVTNSTRGFIGIAPSFKMDANNRPLIAQDIRAELGPLDYNIPEVTALQKIVGGKILTGNKANLNAFMDIAPTAKILHLATHGKANDQKGDYAYLALAETTDKKEDQFLYNRDLYNMPLNAEMVVLSACETGIGELQKGEGIISLARGFSYAGAKSIITTLWSINDEKSKELMLAFYTNLKNGQSKDAALRQAKLDFMDKYSHRAHPFFWAAFIPIGDMSPITFQNNYNNYFLMLLALAVVVMSWFYFKKR